jgi:hypothetical protein
VGLTIADLKAAMAPIAQIGKGELVFDIQGTTIALRALTPAEEIQVQRFARASLAEGDLTDQANALEYLDKFRVGSLGYSLVQVGELSFRDLETIETGAKLSNGVTVKIPKNEAIQQLVHTWSRNMTVAVFAKFAELMNRVEKEVDDVIDFEPVDYDAEITRLEEKLRELKEERGRQKVSQSDPRSKIRQEVATSKKSFKTPLDSKEITPEERAAASDAAQLATEQEAETLAVPSNIDREIIEEPLMEESENPPEAPEAAPRKAVFARENVRMPPPAPSAPTEEGPSDPEGDPGDPPPVDRLPDVESSFIDMADPEATEKAIEAENRRLMDMRTRGRTPPHLAAKKVAESLPAPETAKVVGTMDNKDVYRMPTQNLTGRKSPEAAPAPTKSNINPRFKPTRGG